MTVGGALALAAGTSFAATVRVEPGGRFPTVASGVAAAARGDTVTVAPGIYNEHGIVIDRAIVLRGEPGAVIDAGDAGEIITVTADGVTVGGLTLRNVGTSFMEDRAAVRLAGVRGCVVAGNTLENAFFGIYAEKARNCAIRGNTLRGSATRQATSGNGIHLWYCRDMTVADNRVSGHRDGIYFEFVEQSRVTGNESVDNLRYGLHFMFSHDDVYEQNHFARNGAGVAVMYTQNVIMRRNTFEHNWGNASYGLLLKEIRDSEITHNRFHRNTVGLYTEGSNRVRVERNTFTSNGYAVRVMANSMENVFSDNDFVGNAFDVSTNSRQNFNTFDANYWSDYRGYDLDRDGVGDVPHHPVRLFSLLVEKQPPGVVLMGSLFVRLIDTAERALPMFTPETLVDARPRMEAVMTGGR
jgi:nitrous oxidase accessory protein